MLAGRFIQITFSVELIMFRLCRKVQLSKVAHLSMKSVKYTSIKNSTAPSMNPYISVVSKVQ